MERCCRFSRLSVILLYGIVTPSLWQAPVYGWLLLVSGWARRATFLWAVLPWLAICVVEKIAFNTAYFAPPAGAPLLWLATGARSSLCRAAQRHSRSNRLSQLTP